MSVMDYPDLAPSFVGANSNRIEHRIPTLAEMRAQVHARCKERDRLFPDHCHNGRWRPARTTVWRIAP